MDFPPSRCYVSVRAAGPCNSVYFGSYVGDVADVPGLLTGPLIRLRIRGFACPRRSRADDIATISASLRRRFHGRAFNLVPRRQPARQ
jgi:hypothetical protein